MRVHTVAREECKVLEVVQARLYHNWGMLSCHTRLISPSISLSEISHFMAGSLERSPAALCPHKFLTLGPPFPLAMTMSSGKLQ